jgi:hypothetical protein
MTCAVCHRKRIHGARSDSGDVFVCLQCQADARQFLEIQDSIWPEARAAGDSSTDIDKPTHP